MIVYEDKYLRIKNGDYIRLLKPIKDGLIDLPVLSSGEVVYSRNQVEANIWFHSMDLQYWKHPIRIGLEVEKVELRGLVLEVKAKDFAVVYNYKEHKNIHIDSRKAIDLPFFSFNERLTKIPALWYINNERGTQYLLDEVIDLIEEEFSDWVIDNTKTRKIYKYERENGDYPEEFDRVLNDKSVKIYREKREEIELKFAQVTGLYYEFKGGLIDG